MMKKAILSAVILVCLLSIKAAAQFSLTGEINARAEFRNGFKKLSSSVPNPAFFIEQRSRLYANYKADKLEFQFTLQDVRMWGANGQVYKSDNGMTAISDGWGRYYFVPKFSVKAGRQMIAYDNERIFGGLEWAMQGRRHDALLFMFEDSTGFKLHGGLAYNQSPAVPEPVKLTGTSYPPSALGAYHATANYKDMQFLWMHKDYASGFYSLYFINDGRQYGSTADSLAHRQTYGIMASKKLGGVTLNGEAFYQGGKVATYDLSAYMFSLSAAFKTGSVPLTVGYDLLSGQDPDSEKVTTFSPLYGTNHKFYGFMDYFYVGNPHANKGLQDIYLKSQFKVAKGSLMTHIHYFLAASEITKADNSKASSGLGAEIDLVYSRTLSPGATIKIGYSQMLASDSMELIKGGSSKAFNNWAWAQLIFKPKLL